MEELTKKRGLLQKASSILVEVTPRFSDWTIKNGFLHAGIFALSNSEQLSEQYYYLTEVAGLNAKTIASSVSPKSFWDTKLSKSFDWQCFSKDFNEVSQFLDLFDDKKKDSITSLYFLPFGDKDNPMIFVVTEYEDEDSITLPPASDTITVLKNIVSFQKNEDKILSNIEKSVEEGFKISPSFLFILSLKSYIEKILQNPDVDRKLSKIDKIDRIEIKTNIINSITNASYSIVEDLFKSPNCIHLGTNGEIKIALFTKDEQDEQVLSFHIATTLSDLFGSDIEKQILLLSAGICPNTKGTISFLQKG